MKRIKARLTPEMFVICLPIELHYSAGKMTASLFCVVCSHLNHSPTGHFTVFGASNSVDQRDWSTEIISIDGFWFSKIVKRSVGMPELCYFVKKPCPLLWRTKRRRRNVSNTMSYFLSNAWGIEKKLERSESNWLPAETTGSHPHSSVNSPIFTL